MEQFLTISEREGLLSELHLEKSNISNQGSHPGFLGNLKHDQYKTFLL